MKKSHLLLLVLPYVILALGVAANQAAIHANGRLMPVLVPGHLLVTWASDENHTAMISTTHLKFLGDWIISNNGVSSIGDFLQSIAIKLEIPSIVAFIGVTMRDIFGK